MSKVTPEETSYKYAWMIRPCEIYIDEYNECKYWKSRFHQYFIHGHKVDCSSWQKDFKNCKIWEKNKSMDAYNAIIESEKERRMNRLKGHVGNTIWQRRDEPPEDWNNPLPQWMQENFKDSYLEKIKNKDAQEVSDMLNKYCVIM